MLKGVLCDLRHRRAASASSTPVHFRIAGFASGGVPPGGDEGDGDGSGGGRQSEGEGGDTPAQVASVEEAYSPQDVGDHVRQGQKEAEQ